LEAGDERRQRAKPKSSRQNMRDETQSVEQAEGARSHESVADEAEAAKGDCGQNRDDKPAVVASEGQNSQEDDDGT
jgi:hypothetical protein